MQAKERDKVADHRENVGGTWTGYADDRQEAMSYDLNGNIASLIRKGFAGFNMDNLAYNYTGNRLNYVNDSGEATDGFVNGNTGTDDYDYDPNGNLNKDKNKGIDASGIKYNYLNLVRKVHKTGADSLVYTYDASGRKLAQQLYGTGAKTTDYIGELVYEGNALQFIQHAEGRVVPDGGGWEYQYHLKDHLGNVRVTFTSKAQTAMNYTTDFEGTEAPDFQNYTNRTGYDLVDHTDAGATYLNVQWLREGNRVGLAKSIAVMSGDEITASAHVKYMNVSGSPNTGVFLTALASAFGVSAGGPGEQPKIYQGLNNFAGLVTGGDHPGDDEGAPKAFATILFFDKNYNFLDAAWDQVDTDGAQTSGSVKQPPHDFVSVTAKAPECGYAYIFLSNEHYNLVDVYFDDATFSHTPSPIVSSSEYYPFGLAFNASTRSTTPLQNYQYNGKELQDELSLGWLDYGARMYNAEVGRWFAVDPLADISRRWSPYAYALDNPMRFIDPDGMYAEDTSDRDKWNRRATGNNGLGVAENVVFDHEEEKPAAKSEVKADDSGGLGIAGGYSSGEQSSEGEQQEIDPSDPYLGPSKVPYYDLVVKSAHRDVFAETFVRQKDQNTVIIRQTVVAISFNLFNWDVSEYGYERTIVIKGQSVNESTKHKYFKSPGLRDFIYQIESLHRPESVFNKYVQFILEHDDEKHKAKNKFKGSSGMHR